MVYFLILAFTIFTFYSLPQTFFQQDEWATFGLIALFDRKPLEAIKILLPRGFFSHFAPTAFFFDYLQYKFFNLEFAPYAYFSLALHLLNSILVYYLFRLISGKRKLSLLASLIFVVSSFSHQAVTWISTSTSTQGATLFALISLILFFSYLNNPRPKIIFLGLSLFFFLVSLTLKENTFFLFIFLPISWLIFFRKKTAVGKQVFLSLFCFAVFYFGLRLLLAVIAPPLSGEEAKVLFRPAYATYVYRLGALPLRALSQSLISPKQIISWAERLVFIAYPQFVAIDGAANPFVVESITFDLIGSFISVLALLVSYSLYRFLLKNKEPRLAKGLLFSFALIFTSTFPFIFIPGKAGYSSIFEPRNLYITGIGSSLFLGTAIFAISQKLSSKITKIFSPGLRKKTLGDVLLVVLAVPILISHIKIIHGDLKQLVSASQLRKSTLSQIINTYPRLPEKVVFYTESDKAYYGLPEEEKILPFQSGFGQTLLVWYHAHEEKFPPCMFANLWLYQIEEQGYQYCQGRGFGYFRKYEDLVQTIKENKLGPENIIAFSFSEKGNRLLGITPRVRSDLKRAKGVD